MGTATTAIAPDPDPATAALENTTFSYLDIAACLVEDWRSAHPEENGDAAAVADAILGSFSTARLRALLLAHLLA